MDERTVEFLERAEWTVKVWTIWSLRFVFLLVVGSCACCYLIFHHPQVNYCQPSRPRTCSEAVQHVRPGPSIGAFCSCRDSQGGFHTWRTRPLDG